MARKRNRDYAQENAARRLRRQAATREKKAAKLTGAARERLLREAKTLREQIAKTYKRPPKESGISEKQWQRQRQRVINQTSRAPVRRAERRQRSAETILSNKNIAHRFYGGLVDIWDIEENRYTRPDGTQGFIRENVDKTILEHFGAQDILDVMQMMEDAGINLYAEPENDDRYTDISVRIMDYASGFQN